MMMTEKNKAIYLTIPIALFLQKIKLHHYIPGESDSGKIYGRQG